MTASVSRSPLARPRRPALLAVDDDEGVRDAYALIFEDWMDVVGVASAATALAAAGRRRFDAVLLDIRMPRVSGLDVFEDLRTLQPGVPIIFVSAVNAVETAVTAIRLGAFDHVTKPFDADTLTGLVRRAVAAASGVVSIVGSDLGFCAAATVLAAARDAIPAVIGAMPDAIRTVDVGGTLAAAYAAIAPAAAPLGEFVARMATYVGTHYARINVDTLAEALHLSSGHLSRTFREETSLTAKDYVTRVRMEIARYRLRETVETLEAIAEHVGLCGAPHFAS